MIVSCKQGQAKGSSGKLGVAQCDGIFTALMDDFTDHAAVVAPHLQPGRVDDHLGGPGVVPVRPARTIFSLFVPCGSQIRFILESEHGSKCVMIFIQICFLEWKLQKGPVQRKLIIPDLHGWKNY